ncbi:MAG: DUF4150 domain-containing protein [Gammaproteobacteria bacterium]|nr:DUF4150 domain-containing protein [Gammaproteobacteria bacterium]MBU1776145.1 DUF4150 domain-containing protein [Gammaproteobacteria bacterium]
MGQNININGESAVHMGSEGKLTTSDTCMTPPYCVPITYTNLAESKVADQTVSSVKIQGNPACNQKSIFKISQGDSPGCCGGVASGSVGQMTKFIEGSSNVTIGGEPAVYNGLLKTSNAENTDSKPLVQPPAGKAPEGKITEQEPYSHVVVLTDAEGNVLTDHPHRAWMGNEVIMEGKTDTKGASEKMTEDAGKHAEIALLTW